MASNPYGQGFTDFGGGHQWIRLNGNDTNRGKCVVFEAEENLNN